MATRTLGAAGIALIQGYEKLRLIAYQDQGGIWTIGWGHTGPEVVEGLVWTREQADAQFLLDTAHAVKGVDICTNEPMTQNQFDAMVSLAFNIGVTNFHDSRLVKLQNAQQVAAAAEEFGRWIYVKGIRSEGLVERRAAERALFLS